MAKRIPYGHIMVNDPTTGALFPWLQKTIARLVIFPDGEDLWTHWQKEMTEVNKAKFRREETKLGNNTFNWETNTFGNSNAVLKLHTVMALPVQTGNNLYIYKIALPTLYVPDKKKVTYDGASFSVLERENSTFMRRHCLHNVYIDVVNNSELWITVDHLKGIDNVNLGTERYITGGFDITCDVSFNPYNTNSFTS